LTAGRASTLCPPCVWGKGGAPDAVLPTGDDRPPSGGEDSDMAALRLSGHPPPLVGGGTRRRSSRLLKNPHEALGRLDLLGLSGGQGRGVCGCAALSPQALAAVRCPISSIDPRVQPPPLTFYLEQRLGEPSGGALAGKLCGGGGFLGGGGGDLRGSVLG